MTTALRNPPNEIRFLYYQFFRSFSKCILFILFQRKSLIHNNSLRAIKRLQRDMLVSPSEERNSSLYAS